MINFFVLLVFGGIGAIFGPVGFLVGIILGIIGWVSSEKDKSKAKPVRAESIYVKNLHEQPHQSSLLPVSEKNFIPQESNKQYNKNPSVFGLEDAREYIFCVVQLYTFILSFYTSNDSSKVNVVTDILKSDDWIRDKAVALDELAGRLQQTQVERINSPILFQLHWNALIERVLLLPNFLKLRIAIQLDGFSDSFSESDSIDCKDYVEVMRHALRQNSPVSKERLDAEEYITRSGDPKAINTLQEMRQNPSRYKELLKSGATGNIVLKTALGVFAGILAADVVKAAVTDYQIKNLLTQLDSDIKNSGGIDSLKLQDKELESFTKSELAGDSFSSFNGGVEEKSWDNTLPSQTSEVGISDLSIEDTSISDSMIYDYPEVDVFTDNSVDNVTFDFDD